MVYCDILVQSYHGFRNKTIKITSAVRHLAAYTSLFAIIETLYILSHSVQGAASAEHDYTAKHKKMSRLFITFNKFICEKMFCDMTKIFLLVNFYHSS